MAERAKTDDMFTATCPYCRTGHAEVSFATVVASGELTDPTRQYSKPGKCSFCGKLFRVVVGLRVIGRKLKDK